MSAKIKILTGIYLLIVAGIIVVADIKSTSYLLSFVGNIPYGDKIGHFVLFGVLAFLVNFAFGMRNLSFGRFEYLLGSLIVIIGITVEELTQIFMRGRTFSWLDLFCGYAGILVFGEIARIIYRRFFSNNQDNSSESFSVKSFFRLLPFKR